MAFGALTALWRCPVLPAARHRGLLDAGLSSSPRTSRTLLSAPYVACGKSPFSAAVPQSNTRETPEGATGTVGWAFVLCWGLAVSRPHCGWNVRGHSHGLSAVDGALSVRRERRACYLNQPLQSRDCASLRCKHEKMEAWRCPGFLPGPGSRRRQALVYLTPHPAPGSPGERPSPCSSRGRRFWEQWHVFEEGIPAPVFTARAAPSKRDREAQDVPFS